jgi:hypothetical protein
MIREELAAGTLKELPVREGTERFGELYMIFAERDHAGQAALCRDYPRDRSGRVKTTR